MGYSAMICLSFWLSDYQLSCEFKRIKAGVNMGVYILAKQTRGVKYLYAIETKYVERQGRRHRTQRVLKSFGRLDRLLKDDPNIIEHLKTLYCQTRNQDDTIQATQQAQLDSDSKSTVETQISDEEFDAPDVRDEQFKADLLN